LQNSAIHFIKFMQFKTTNILSMILYHYKICVYNKDIKSHDNSVI